MRSVSLEAAAPDLLEANSQTGSCNLYFLALFRTARRLPLRLLVGSVHMAARELNRKIWVLEERSNRPRVLILACISQIC